MPRNDKGIVVIAPGSRFRGDDGIGPLVAEALRGRLADCRIIEGAGDALAIIDAWDGASLAVVVDAAQSGAAPGTVHRLEIAEAPLPSELGCCSSHGLGLAEAVELGRLLKRLPARLVVYAVEARTFEPGAKLSPAVAKAADKVQRDIEAEIASFGKAPA